MANRLFDIMFQEGNHEVGVINTSWAKVTANGAKLTTADSDNYLLVEFDGYDDEGVRQCKPLTDGTKKGLILSTVEEESLFGDGSEMLQGNYKDFYNKVGEMVRLTIQEPFVRFETSAFSLNTGIAKSEDVKRGFVAHFDVATKKYIISDSATPHANYATAANKYEVVDVMTDFGYNVGKVTMRLECK
jgi:hypothetical protein